MKKKILGVQEGGDRMCLHPQTGLRGLGPIVENRRAAHTKEDSRQQKKRTEKY